MTEKTLIDFQFYLHDKGLITNHDWVYALEANKFIKKEVIVCKKELVEEKTTYELLLEGALDSEESKNYAMAETIVNLIEENAKLKSEVSALKFAIEGRISDYNRLRSYYIDVKFEKFTLTDKLNKIPNLVKWIFGA